MLQLPKPSQNQSWLYLYLSSRTHWALANTPLLPPKVSLQQPRLFQHAQFSTKLRRQSGHSYQWCKHKSNLMLSSTAFVTYSGYFLNWLWIFNCYWSQRRCIGWNTPRNTSWPPCVESQGKATYAVPNRCIRGPHARWRGSETIFYKCRWEWASHEMRVAKLMWCLPTGGA